ncbi:MAG: aminotransferase class III-fold pyridoxal phosphate-dependent enzyme [Thermodesulfobacteriota bacterium]
MTLAKGIAAGMPLGAIVSRKAIMKKWPSGAHGTTLGGNPISCAAAIATVRVIEEEGLLNNARLVGESARKRLAAMQRRFPLHRRREGERADDRGRDREEGQ